jgi:hypothetical protein
MRPCKIQRELECLGIDAVYLCMNGMDLFHLGTLGRLMRCVLSLSLPSSVCVVEVAADAALLPCLLVIAA